MMNDQKINAAKIGNTLVKFTGYYGSALKMIRLVYLYSIVSEAGSYNRIGLEEMKAIFALQTSFSEGRFDLDTIKRALEASEKEQPTFLPRTMESVVKSYDFLVQMSPEYQKAIANAIKSIELPDDNSARWELLSALLERAGRDVSQLGGFVTPKSIADLCNGLLQVKPTDS